MHLRRPIKTLITITIALVFLYISTAGVSAATTLVVTGNSLNLRSGPGTSYKVVAGLKKGEKVTLVASKPGWHQVKTSQGIVGWASVMYLGNANTATSTPATSTSSTSTASQTTTVTKVQVTGKTVNLRQGPSTSSALVGQCKQGDLLTWQKTLSGWYQVVTSAGKTAYISSNLAVLKTVTTTAPASSATPAAQPATTAKVKVTGSSVNLRTAPSTKAALAGSSKKGDLFTWQKTLSGWYQVLTPAGKTVYISSSLSVLIPAASSTPAASPASQQTPVTSPTSGSDNNQTGKLQVTGSEVNLRSGPGTNYPVVGKVKKDQVLVASQEQNGWYEVAAAGDERAWVIASLVRVVTPLAVNTPTPATPTDPDPVPNQPTTPSRGDENRPEVKTVTVNSGADDLGDFLTLIGEDGVNPTVNQQDNVVTAFFPNSRIAQGAPTRIDLTEDKSIGLDIVYATRDNGQEARVSLPNAIKTEVRNENSRVIIRIPPQVISLLPVTVPTGSEVVELRSTSPITVESNSAGQNPRIFTLRGTSTAQTMQQTGSTAFDIIELSASSSGAEARVVLKSGYVVDLVKVKGDVYRFYFRKQPVAGQPPTIMVDPGHGGSETGAIYYNTQEKVLNLAMGLKLGQALEAKGYRVLYMRKDDVLVPLADRATIANAEKPDLYVSVHCNAMTNNSTVQGTMTYYWPSDDPLLNQQRKDLATYVQSSLMNRLGTVDKGVRTGEFVVIKYTSMPAVLVETAFMSNPEDFARLTSEDFQWQVAHGIVEGIGKYLAANGFTVPNSSTPSDKPPGW